MHTDPCHSDCCLAIKSLHDWLRLIYYQQQTDTSNVLRQNFDVVQYLLMRRNVAPLLNPAVHQIHQDWRPDTEHLQNARQALN